LKFLAWFKTLYSIKELENLAEVFNPELIEYFGRHRISGRFRVISESFSASVPGRVSGAKDDNAVCDVKKLTNVC
jgi:hypothetical protein